MAVVVLDQVSRWYGQVLGLNRVSVSLAPGVTGLLGPNGAGKSTFMKLITGLLRPSAGVVRVLGESPWDNPALMRRIGYVPDIDSFYEEMTGRELVTMLTRLHGFSPSEAADRAERALQDVRLGDAMDRPVARYSKGMRQKCKMAQAIAHEPDLLVLDEPLTGADPVSRHHLIELVRRMARERGTSVIVSSHVLHEVEALTREILLIHRGRVLAEGSVRQLRDLIDEHPHRVHIGCDKPRELAALAVAQPFVLAARVRDEVLELETPDPATCYRELPRLALEAGLRLRTITSPDNSIEAVFRYLVG
ncbi:MAG: ABC transporter ATP-binding protein [Myxococcales bacterium]